MTSGRSVLAAFAVILLDLAWRAGLDKVLALVNTPALVAMWAQLQSVVDLVSGVALAGIAQGLTVLIAQARNKQEEAGLLRAALKLGPAVALIVAILFLIAMLWLQPWLTRGKLDLHVLALAALTGCIAVLPGLISAYWLGRHQQYRVLQFALLGAVPWLAVAWAIYHHLGLHGLITVQCSVLLLVTLPMGWYLIRLAEYAEDGPALRRMAHFIPVGLAIGIMSPASMLIVRGALAASLSWNEAGLMQALWRSAEWVTSGAAGVLSLIFLPRLSAMNGTPRFAHEFRRAALIVLLPSAFLLLLIFFNQRAVLLLLYDARFVVSDKAAALFMLGSLIRIASWVFLFGLYAARRTVLIAAGEILSLPLFALLLWMYAAQLSLEWVALLYCTTYLVYLTFNAAGLFYSQPWRADPEAEQAYLTGCGRPPASP
jgi:polysaccharide transporter, PST family